jgi:S-(hydroxymethyl)glutathione dehydrogenase / alcohol dehydrogenase
MIKFKAAILEKLNSPLSIKEIASTPLKFGQVLVKVSMSGLCGSQLHEIKGHKGNEKFLPHLLGHEGCGHVVEIGVGVKNVSVGDKVVMHWRCGKGIESDFPNYMLDERLISSGKVTTINEYSIVSENRLTKVDEDTPDELCCLLGCSLTTAFGVVDNEIDLKFGESALVIGGGGVGLNLIQALKMKGACPIAVLERQKSKQEICFTLGAQNFYYNIEQIDKKFDIIIDTSGDTLTISKALCLLSNSGRFILVGQPAPKETLEIFNAVGLFGGNGCAIKATQGGQTNPSLDIEKYIKMYKANYFDIKPLISKYYSLYEINDAFNNLKSGEALRIMIRF